MTLTAPISVVPSSRSLTYDLLLTATTAISHHDPAVHDDSNRMLFNRQKHLLSRPVESAPLDQSAIDAITAVHRVPESIAALFDDVSLPEYVASALTRLFLDCYNSADGEGVFAGMERYSRLEARLRQAATQSQSLARLWDRLVDSLQVSIHDERMDAILLPLLRLPKPLQQAALRAIAADYRSIVALARLWHGEAKLTSAKYAAAVGRATSGDLVMLHYEATLPDAPETADVIELPAVSGNSLRHEVVREPSWLHLCQCLGIVEGTPGRGQVPAGVEAIFYNGGNIAAGAKQPTNVFALAHRARALYPSLDLLGGVTDSFDLGESRLRVAGWLVCRENAAALRGTPAEYLPAARVSAYDLLDDVTLTRQAGRLGLGQMIYSFETMCPGTQVLCRLALAPHTPRLTRGALVAAVGTYLGDVSVVGGQSARGFGAVAGEWIGERRDDDAAVYAEYHDYCEVNRDALLAGLCDGTLGTGARILT